MALLTNYDNVSELIPEGEYEIIIRNAQIAYTNGGTDYISIPMYVRNDVQQPQHNRIIWHKMWQRKEPNQDDLQLGGYSYKQFQQLSKAVGFPAGTNFADLTDWLNKLNGRVCRITVEHDEYKGNINARVKWTNATKQESVNHVWKTDLVAAIDGFVVLDDDIDLPF